MKMSTNLSTKRCSQCEETKPIEQFSKNKTKKDGLHNECKLCHNAYHAAWRAANLDKVKANNAAWYAANSEKAKATKAAWYAANSDKAKANDAAWYAANSEKAKATKAAWRKANPDKCNARNAKRRAAKLQAMLKYGKEHLQADIQVWYTRAKLATQFMGEPYHVDHIVPLQGKTVSGLHVPWNLQLLTASENSKKGNKHADT